ncbi:hypothetical protein EAF04_004009 [Stromatinia cepivora]|nr:hypothetical protein EAF04_004009 [Stromatinia cepivora]
MPSSHDQNATMATTATSNLTPKHSPKKKSAEEKAQTSLTLNSYLYATSNVIERLSQGATTSKKGYRAQAKKAIVAFDEAFQGKK